MSNVKSSEGFDDQSHHLPGPNLGLLVALFACIDVWLGIGALVTALIYAR